MAFVNDADKVPKEDIPVLLKNKKYFESRSEDVRSGALGMVETGPREFRPSFTKRLF